MSETGNGIYLLQKMGKQKSVWGGKKIEWAKARQKGYMRIWLSIFEVCVHVKPNNFKQ